MGASVGYVVIDSQDPDRLSAFWSHLLGAEIGGAIGGGQYVLVGPTATGLVLTLQRVPEPKVGKNRLHLDVVVDDLDAATSRVEELGGRWIEPGVTRQLEGFTWRCLADPEGNEFDLVVVDEG